LQEDFSEFINVDNVDFDRICLIKYYNNDFKTTIKFGAWDLISIMCSDDYDDFIVNLNNMCIQHHSDILKSKNYLRNKKLKNIINE
jgi:hypothetical protein